MRPVITFLLIFLSGVIVSCTKSKPVEDPLKQSTSLLTAAPWKLSSYTAYTMYGFTDLFPGYPDCKKDNLTIFYAGGNGEYNEGPTKCDPADLQARILNWVFKNNGNTLSIDNLDWRIDQLSSSTLVLFRRTPTYDEYKATYTH